MNANIFLACYIKRILLIQLDFLYQKFEIKKSITNLVNNIK